MYSDVFFFFLETFFRTRLISKFHYEAEADAEAGEGGGNVPRDYLDVNCSLIQETSFD